MLLLLPLPLLQLQAKPGALPEALDEGLHDTLLLTAAAAVAGITTTALPESLGEGLPQCDCAVNTSAPGLLSWQTAE